MLACVATAEVEQAQELETSEAPAAPTEAVEQRQPAENVDSRRRARSGQQRRPKKEVIYSINDIVVGQEVDAVVVRSRPSCCLCFPQGTLYCRLRVFSWWQVGVTTYGAFVDYGAGKDALIHISQLMVSHSAHCKSEPRGV